MSNSQVKFIEGGNKKSDTTVIIFHGYGANANDLAPLQKLWDSENKFHWYFPSGIIDLAMSPNMESRAWFPIDMVAYEKAMQKGEFRSLSASRPKGLDEARDFALKFIEKVVPSGNKIILGGFSQGAMLSMEVSFYLGSFLKGLVLLSGAFLDEAGWTSKFENIKHLNFYQSHGKRDPVLDFKEAKRMNEKLNSNGVKGIFSEFNGEHEIPMNIILEVKDYLHKL